MRCYSLHSSASVNHSACRCVTPLPCPSPRLQARTWTSARGRRRWRALRRAIWTCAAWTRAPAVGWPTRTCVCRPEVSAQAHGQRSAGLWGVLLGYSHTHAYVHSRVLLMYVTGLGDGSCSYILMWLVCRWNGVCCSDAYHKLFSFCRLDELSDFVSESIMIAPTASLSHLEVVCASIHKPASVE